MRERKKERERIRFSSKINAIYILFVMYERSIERCNLISNGICLARVN